MSDTLNRFSMTGVAGAIAACMGIASPAQAEEPLQDVIDLVRRNIPGGQVDRVIMYNPDAIAQWIWQKYTHMFAPVYRHTQLAVPLRTVMPSVTPVCFGTMYTGALPEVHGIRSYMKPVIRIDTLFDALLRSGKRCAILGDTSCSMSHIFLEKDMDYYAFDTVDEINEKALELIEKDEHDLIAVYNGNYDHEMHLGGPEGETALKSLEKNCRDFDRLMTRVEERWKGHDTLAAFAMDHGCHEIDGNLGSHGLDMPEDLNVVHFYGAFPRKKD